MGANTPPIRRSQWFGLRDGLSAWRSDRPLIERYLRLTERLTQLSRDTLCRDALAFLPLIERLSPAYVEEVRGLAAGA